MDNTFVSRGGLKLQHALDKFKISAEGKVVLDVGSSTGGFVDCLLQNGAAKIYSVDTSYGELAWKLRNDPRVVVMERTNILHLKSLPPTASHSGKSTRPESQILEAQASQDDNVKVDIITIDAGWTKLELVLPVVKPFLKPDGQIIALLKPHYETVNKNRQKGVVPAEIVNQIKNQVLENIKNLGFEVTQTIESPILGGAGNTEFLVWIKS